MAIWQYSFVIVPDTISNREFLCVSKWQAIVNYNFWYMYKYEINKFNEIEKILPKGESWHDEVIIFGDVTSNCITLVEEEKVIAEMSIRLDLRTDYPNLLNKLSTLACLSNVLLVAEDGFIAEINSDTIAAHVSANNHLDKFNDIHNPD
ncbi:hypothetical protein IC235_13140 [Hymenobacter sp. BT664]|uniref:Uncharacterized protein n=1 Tax=Hymenobacter montanus TaxID=2771359 RepID=A0A927GK57_9BACT|nr:hypothetical protein [Hymenobacter montanus]MBD2768834.1 hypothetical protein [Hymenobacter montanus]